MKNEKSFLRIRRRMSLRPAFALQASARAGNLQDTGTRQIASSPGFASNASPRLLAMTGRWMSRWRGDQIGLQAIGFLLLVLAIAGCCSETVDQVTPELYGVVPGDGSLTLYWTPAIYEKQERRCGTHPADPDYEGYNVYLYTDSTYYDSSYAFYEAFKQNSALIRAGEFKLDTLANGVTYFVHVTAFWKTGARWKSNPGSGIPKK